MIILSLVFAASLFATDPATIAIWPNQSLPDNEATQLGPNDKFHRVHDVSRPTITPVLPPEGKRNGASVLILPGGGFVHLSIDNEGYDVARWLNSLGVSAFVVKYRLMSTGKRTPQDRADALKLGTADSLEAIRIIRSRAKEWNLDPKRIGVIGFSAGGYHAAMSGLKFNSENRPDFIACLYPAAPEALDVPSNAPPVFIFAADDDRLTPAKNSIPIYLVWKNAKLPAEIHIVAKGGHGFGMKKAGAPTDAWIDRFQEWMTGLGVLPK